MYRIPLIVAPPLIIGHPPFWGHWNILGLQLVSSKLSFFFIYRQQLDIHLANTKTHHAHKLLSPAYAVDVMFSSCLCVCLFGLQLLNELTWKLYFWHGVTS